MKTPSLTTLPLGAHWRTSSQPVESKQEKTSEGNPQLAEQ